MKINNKDINSFINDYLNLLIANNQFISINKLFAIINAKKNNNQTIVINASCYYTVFKFAQKYTPFNFKGNYNFIDTLNLFTTFKFNNQKYLKNNIGYKNNDYKQYYDNNNILNLKQMYFIITNNNEIFFYLHDYAWDDKKNLLYLNKNLLKKFNNYIMININYFSLTKVIYELKLIHNFIVFNKKINKQNIIKHIFQPNNIIQKFIYKYIIF